MPETFEPLAIRSSHDVAALLDHAILHPTVTPAALAAEVEQTAPLGLASLCVRPGDVPTVAGMLAGTATAAGTVIGFPHGTTSTAAKVAEARQAIRDGAAELDMVLHVGAAIGGAWLVVRDDIAAVLGVARDGGALLKVIFETDYVTDDATKIRLCEICGELGADFVKTSTGFGYVKQPDGSARYTGATEHDIRLMRRHTPATVGVKPSGGIRTLDDVLKFVALGATRIGTASAVAIVDAARRRYEGDAGDGAAPRAGDRQLEY